MRALRGAMPTRGTVEGAGRGETRLEQHACHEGFVLRHGSFRPLDLLAKDRSDPSEDRRVLSRTETGTCIDMVLEQFGVGRQIRDQVCVSKGLRNSGAEVLQSSQRVVDGDFVVGCRCSLVQVRWVRNCRNHGFCRGFGELAVRRICISISGCEHRTSSIEVELGY